MLLSTLPTATAKLRRAVDLAQLDPAATPELYSHLAGLVDHLGEQSTLTFPPLTLQRTTTEGTTELVAEGLKLNYHPGLDVPVANLLDDEGQEHVTEELGLTPESLVELVQTILEHGVVELHEGLTQIKRRYTERYPAVRIRATATKRNRLLEFVHQQGGTVQRQQLTDFLHRLEEEGGEGNTVDRSWFTKNRDLLARQEDKEGNISFKLTTKGQRVVDALVREGQINPAKPLAEAATSQAQQRLMGMAYAYKKGELKLNDLPAEVRDQVQGIADGMTLKDLKDFASTKHEGLPDKVEEAVGDGGVATPGAQFGMGPVTPPAPLAVGVTPTGSGDVFAPLELPTLDDLRRRRKHLRGLVSLVSESLSSGDKSKLRGFVRGVVSTILDENVKIAPTPAQASAAYKYAPKALRQQAAKLRSVPVPTDTSAKGITPYANELDFGRPKGVAEVYVYHTVYRSVFMPMYDEFKGKTPEQITEVVQELANLLDEYAGKVEALKLTDPKAEAHGKLVEHTKVDEDVVNDYAMLRKDFEKTFSKYKVIRGEITSRPEEDGLGAGYFLLDTGITKDTPYKDPKELVKLAADIMGEVKQWAKKWEPKVKDIDIEVEPFVPIPSLMKYDKSGIILGVTVNLTDKSTTETIHESDTQNLREKIEYVKAATIKAANEAETRTGSRAIKGSHALKTAAIKLAKGDGYFVGTAKDAFDYFGKTVYGQSAADEVVATNLAQAYLHRGIITRMIGKTPLSDGRLVWGFLLTTMPGQNNPEIQLLAVA